MTLGRQTERSSTTQLLESHGFILRANSGVYTLLPLGLRVEQRIEAVIRKHLEAAGAVELALPSIVDPALWRRSGRLTEDAREFIFTHDKQHLLAPTGEEQITTTVGSVSYRQLPLCLYQITRKYRNELRPRGGLMRTREFVMKDLYTFDESREKALTSYEKVRGAYTRIFDELGVPYVVAVADSGNMGGNMSHEFHYLMPDGDDTIIHSQSGKYAANLEAAASRAHHTAPQPAAVNLNYAGHVVTIPESRDLSPVLVARALDAGAKLVDWRLPGGSCPLVVPVEGELAPCADNDLLHFRRGVEVGHMFYLGRRYTSSFESLVTHADGKTSPIEMGCYGIGVTRLVGAIAAALRDSHGLVWPRSIAPADAIVVSSDPSLAEEIANELVAGGLDAVYENRTTQLGHALRVAREAGWPAVVIAGRHYAEAGELEVEMRATGGSTYVRRGDAVVKHLLAQR